MLFKSTRSKIVTFVVLVVLVITSIELYLRSPLSEPPPAAPIPNEGKIEISGKTVCLPHKIKRSLFGEQRITLECAFGLKGDDGNHYGMTGVSSYENPLGTGTQLELSGMFSRSIHRSLNKYDVVGFIEINDFKVISEPVAPYIP